MNNATFKDFFKNALTFILLAGLCQLLDYSLFLYDHRILLGVIVGAVGYQPVRKLLDKIKSLR